jgi:hypothetical protein
VPRSSIDLFIAAVSSDAVLIWKVMRETPPSVSLARNIFAATVSGLPTRNAPSGPAMSSNCARVGGDQPRPAGKEGVARRGVGLTDETHRVNADLEFAGIMSRLGACLAIVIDRRPEPIKRPTDNGHHQRKA